MKNDHEHILEQATLAHQEGRLADAEKAYLEVLSESPDSGSVLNALGTVFLDQAKPDQAKKVFEKAANLTPPDLSACYNLGRLKQMEGDDKGAITIYRDIVKQQPRFGLAWNNMGVAFREIGEPEEAISCFRRAVAFSPDMAEAWNNLGVAQDEFHMTENASNSYQKAIELQPDYASAHFNLGVSLQKLGRFEAAANHYKKVLEIKPGDEAANFMLQSLGTSTTPDAAPAQHVRRIFDQCAGTFEKTLVNDLEYRTPELLFNLVRPHLQKDLTVLDLGCGTGLGSQFYRPYAKNLIGVDVSSKMLQKASEKNVYDDLIVFDVLQDWSFDQPFDLIYSSDVFVYFGNLDSIMRSASSHLVRGGMIAFSVEKLEGDSTEYRLFPSGRYAHSQQYIRNCLKHHGFTPIEETDASIRKQSGDEVKGLLIVAQKG
ncbi:tetratricopeptide repeat protein [uncultured Desulfosarcina sp.]|uniref:tetratricopeptide repeat protein n=1 Tax=uncultured Desulfosarcina sp. TaxID=218289 RepID=UPI0029C996E2|nr:tetratricopeptide repeat protein [uncultured Desulfosarcina sp.]